MIPKCMFDTLNLLQSGGAWPGGAHDPGGGDPVLPGAGDPPRRQALHQLHRHLVRRLHLRGAARPADTVPGRTRRRGQWEMLQSANTWQQPAAGQWWCEREMTVSKYFSRKLQVELRTTPAGRWYVVHMSTVPECSTAGWWGRGVPCYLHCSCW